MFARSPDTGPEDENKFRLKMPRHNGVHDNQTTVEK